MNYTFYELAMLFFTYSFLAWLAETAVATVKVRNFRNRGFASGPFCFLYGFTGVILTVFLQELKGDVLFLFLGSMAVATAVEWFAGKTLERMKQKKWWDYSDKRWNFDGYICLQYSALWGLLGWNHKLQRWTFRFATKVSGHIEKRIGRSYPAILREKEETVKDQERCGFAQVFWLFLIGALVGDIVERIFCRVTSGIWMSRSSLVWGPFSVVWGLAIALVTVLLYKDRDKQEHYIFWVGVFLGGAYEYICSVFTEILFGKVFWDYSAMPFNLGGRINLLYCFFWGIAAVVWIKGIYPKAAWLIDIILKKTGWVLTGILVVFMAFNVFVSVLALVRYDTRADGKVAVYRWEQAMDEHFDDAKMERIYPNAIRQ